MRLKSTLILLGVALLLFGIVYIFEIRKPKDNGDSKTISNILNIAGKDIVRLKIIHSDPNKGAVEYFKDDSGKWSLEKLPAGELDQEKVQKAIDDLGRRSIYRTIKDPQNLSEYGLDEPFLISILYLNDGTTKTLMFGEEVPIGNYSYFKQDFDADVSMVPSSIVDNFIGLINSSK